MLVALACLAIVACGAPHTSAPQGQGAGEAPVVDVYNWFDYLEPRVLNEFRQKTGITVRYSVFDSNNTLETKLLAGHSGYDVVFPSGAYLASMIPAGVFLKLDKTRLPNLRNLDPSIMSRLAVQDPDNAHAVVYTWGITGLAYDIRKVRARLGTEVPDSWSLLLDPATAGKLADCGIGLYESPNILVPSVLAWLGQDPNSEDPAVLEKAQDALVKVRKSIRKISTGSLVDDLASGELCLIIASNGDAMQAQERTRIGGNGEEVGFILPAEGAVMWMDVAAIPTDAPHPDNAHRFINFLMEAAVAAENTNAIHFPNANVASQSAVRPELRNATIYPRGERAAKLIPELPKSEQYVRLRTRMWTKFRTGE
ncbi:MAG TPA: extracellular solute-binding protein [Steroidobacteraceae bacterium]